jgi:hypothetical protein
MKTILILGFALIVMGEAVLGYDDYRYSPKENLLQIGPLTATAERMYTGSMPPILGWLLIGGGAGMLGFAALSATSKKN